MHITYSSTDWPTSWTLTQFGNQYILNVSINHASIVSGQYTITANISKSGVYNWSTIELSFRLIGNSSHIENFTLMVGSTVLVPSGGQYNSTIASTLTVRFNISDDDWGGKYLGPGSNILSVIIYYNKTSGTPLNGSFSATVDFGIGLSGISGTINLDTLPSIGTYSIIIRITVENYEPITTEFIIQVRSVSGGGLPFEDLLPYCIFKA